MCIWAPLTLTQDEAGLQNRAEELGCLPPILKPRLKRNHLLGPPSLTVRAHTDPHRSPFDCFTRLAFQLTVQSFSGQQFRGSAAEVSCSVTETEIYHYSWVITAFLEGQSITSQIRGYRGGEPSVGHGPCLGGGRMHLL